MKNQELKLFVGGYYDSRIFEGEQFEGKTPFDKNIDTYTLSESLNLGFTGEGFVDWFEGKGGKEWSKTTYEEKINALLEYTATDETSGLIHFKTEKEAEDYKNKVLEEIEDIEKIAIYNGKRQDRSGYFREIYIAN